MLSSRAPQACTVCLAGDAERMLMRNKDATDFNGEVFLQQRDEAAVVARSALSDIVGGKGKGTSKAGSKLFRIMQVEQHASNRLVFSVDVIAAAASVNYVLTKTGF
jgi:hypothetical protein